MKKFIYSVLLIAIPAFVFAQKNVVPATQSQMLGIQLPEGSKQDKRMLSVAAAGSFLSLSSEFKNLEFTPVEVYIIPAASGFKLESIRSQLAANGYIEKFDNGDNKLLWFARNTKSWLVYLSQEAKETNLYIGEGNKSNIITDVSAPVLIASANPAPTNKISSPAQYPANIPPLAGRQTGSQAPPKQVEKKEMQNVVYDLDSNRYEIMKIGNNYWFKENLRTTHYNDTTWIHSAEGQDWSKLKNGAYTVYDNSPINRKKYGLLYNGYAAASGKLCPLGWHVATDADWKELELFFGMPESELERTGERGEIAPKLKVVDDWKPSAFSGNNSSGFGLQPGGARLDNGEFSTLNQYGNFWTSSVYDDRYGLLYLWNHHVHYNTNAVGRIYTIATNGYSCRCVQDKPKPGSQNKK